MNDDILALERLAQLRSSGALTHVEFEREKARILGGDKRVVVARTLGYKRALIVGMALVAVFTIAVLLLMPQLNRRPATPVAPSPTPPAPATISTKVPNSVPRMELPKPTEPKVGDVLSPWREGARVAGWLATGGGFWGAAERHECCIAYFEKGNVKLLALTRVLKTSPTGGVLKEEIIDTIKLTRRRGDEEASLCKNLLDDFPYALVNAPEGRGRGVYSDGHRLFVREFKYEPSDSCSPGEE
jgi:hypothetical protein